MTDWIDVNDRLPDLLQKVLFHAIQDGYLKNVYMGYLSKEGWDIYLPYDSFKLRPVVINVTHWMELPEFPQQGCDEHEPK